MDPRFYAPKPRWKLLISITLVTLFIHGLGIVGIKNYSFYSQQPNTSISQHLTDDSYDSMQLVLKKNKELEKIFSRLMAKSILPNEVQFDLNNPDNDFAPLSSSNFDLNPALIEASRIQKINLPLSEQDFANCIQPSSLTPEKIQPLETETFFNPATCYQQIDERSSSDNKQPLRHIFQQTSLVDHFDSHTLLSHLDENMDAAHPNEPTLFSSNGSQYDENATDESQATIASSSDFIIDVEYASRLDQKGFLFKLTLTPKPYKKFKRIKQNIFFLIDRSRSISSKNFQASKEAVADALDYLHVGDSFNILFFDNKTTKLSPINLPCTSKNIELARHFLSHQKHGGFFSSTDLYSSLDKIIPDVVESDEVNSAILISEGNTYIKKHKRRKTLNFWSQKNRGKISLFTLATGENVNLPMLDLLSILNKGSLRVAKFSETISSELTNLVQSLHSPIGKDIIVTALPHNQQAHMEIYPTQERLPNLYENLQYVLYGSIDQPCDFSIFLQGRYYDHWLDIKKSVAFSKGTLNDDDQLKKGVLLHQAYQEYAQFLQSGHPEFLQKVKVLLEPTNLPLAFE